jgi:hypothetical protein
MRFESTAVWAAVMIAGAAGCSEDVGALPPPPPTAAAPATTTATAAGSTASPTAPAAARGARTAETETLPGSIAIDLLDIQLFHPRTRRRLLADPRDLSERSVERGSGFGVGLLISARNESGYILGSPRILSDVVVTGAHGGASCRVVPRRRSFWGGTSSPLTVLSPQRSERTQWADERLDAEEMVWRPQETLRIRAVLECGPIHLHDIQPSGLSGTFTVAATAPFAEHEVTCDNDHEICGDDVIGRSAPLTLPARAFSLQVVQLPNGGPVGYLAGDIFVHGDQGRVFHDSIADFEGSAFDVPTADLPVTPAPVLDRVDEWSLAIDAITMQHWTDVPTAPKGSRVVTVSGRVSVDSGAIEGRMRSSVDSARVADATARAAVAAASSALSAAPDDATATATLRTAESAARTAASALARAQSAYDRSLGSERSRFARLLACDRVQLVTDFRLLRAVNGRDMAAHCSTLASGDVIAVSWVFVVDRYEVPVGLTYTVGRDPHTAFFAAQSLATFDPR